MFNSILPFIDTFVEDLDKELRGHSSSAALSQCQRRWLKFCLMGILLTNSVNWSAFERFGLGGYKLAALSWMFRHSKLLWPLLLQMGVRWVLRSYGIDRGVLVTDDSDVRRAKKTRRIHKAWKLFDKKTGGYVNGQSIVLLLLVTEKASLPVGFRFYQPDPKGVAWRKEDKRLRRAKVAKSDRPEPPAADATYPDKKDLVLDLVREFTRYHPGVAIKGFLADALFGTQAFMDEASALCGGCQTVSQLRCDQKVRVDGKESSLAKHFASLPAKTVSIRIRGGKETKVTLCSAYLYVKAHRCKRRVIALKYAGETDYRYVVATDAGWRPEEVVELYTLRWLVEVFFEDWKLYEGWGQMAKQPDEEGSCRGVILSLLLDHALLLHPEQRARLEDKAPACTVGSLRQHSQCEAFLDCIRSIVQSENPAGQFAALAEKAKHLFPLAPSEKHMSGRTLGSLNPLPVAQTAGNVACAHTLAS